LAESRRRFVRAKLSVLVVMMQAPALAAALFWAQLVASLIVSYAPHGFRHQTGSGR
jgi:hypothetical protein